MKRDYVCASDLARIGYCERQVAFDAAYGRRTTSKQRMAAERGTRAHEEFLLESRRIAKLSERKGRCFIATLALGECSETAALRQYRDLFLRPNPLGRRIIAVYYRASPHLCRLLERKPAMLSLVRPMLRAVAGLAGIAVRKRTHPTEVSSVR